MIVGFLLGLIFSYVLYRLNRSTERWSGDDGILTRGCYWAMELIGWYRLRRWTKKRREALNLTGHAPLRQILGLRRWAVVYVTECIHGPPPNGFASYAGHETFFWTRWGADVSRRWHPAWNPGMSSTTTAVLLPAKDVPELLAQYARKDPDDED